MRSIGTHSPLSLFFSLFIRQLIRSLPFPPHIFTQPWLGKDKSRQNGETVLNGSPKMHSGFYALCLRKSIIWAVCFIFYTIVYKCVAMNISKTPSVDMVRGGKRGRGKETDSCGNQWWQPWKRERRGNTANQPTRLYITTRKHVWAHDTCRSECVCGVERPEIFLK